MRGRRPKEFVAESIANPNKTFLVGHSNYVEFLPIQSRGLFYHPNVGEILVILDHPTIRQDEAYSIEIVYVSKIKAVQNLLAYRAKLPLFKESTPKGSLHVCGRLEGMGLTRGEIVNVQDAHPRKVRVCGIYCHLPDLLICRGTVQLVVAGTSYSYESLAKRLLHLTLAYIKQTRLAQRARLFSRKDL